MPIFHMECPSCGALKRILDSKPQCKCSCGTDMRRKASGPSSSVKEVLDNGLMGRALERFADAERMYKERSMNADPLAGGAGQDRTEQFKHKEDND